LEEGNTELEEAIEILYADIGVITKYWKKMKNLKWVHTNWNGKPMQ